VTIVPLDVDLAGSNFRLFFPLKEGECDQWVTDAAGNNGFDESLRGYTE